MSRAQRTYEYFKTLSADPETGIKFIQGVEHLEVPPAEYLDKDAVDRAYRHLDDFRVLDDSELPAEVKWGATYQTYVVNSPEHIAYLLRRIVANGGRARQCTLTNLDEAFTLEPNVRSVVNCSGMGLTDEKSFIIRGIHTPHLHLAMLTSPRPNMYREGPMRRNHHTPKR